MASNPKVNKWLGCVCVVFPVTAFSMTELTDHSMSAVTGQDGLTVNLESAAGISADSIQWHTDIDIPHVNWPTTPDTDFTYKEAITHFHDISLEGRDGNPLSATLDLDIGSDGTDPYLALNYAWQPMFTHIGGFTLETPGTAYKDHSLGEVGLYLDSGSLSLINQGIFNHTYDIATGNSSSNSARFDLDLSGDLILRQGGPGAAELSLANFVFRNYFSNGVAGSGGLHGPGMGSVGITEEGIFLQADHTYTDFRFDLMYKEGTVDTDFDLTDRQALFHAGWTGGLENAIFAIRPGGISYDNGVTRSEGLNFQARWDYADDFALVAGHADPNNKTHLRLGGWTAMDSSGPMLSMDIILDILQGDNQPWGGLCMGQANVQVAGATDCAGSGAFVNTKVPNDDSAFALLVRNGGLHAYSSSMQVIDPSVPATAGYDPYDFGLVWTLGQMDADILIYPRGTSTDVGLKMDVAVVTQSPGYWNATQISSEDFVGISNFNELEGYDSFEEFFDFSGYDAGNLSSDEIAEIVSGVRAAAGANWRTNSHLMFANTESKIGVGILNNDFLFEAKDLQLTFGESDLVFDQMHSGIRLGSDSYARYFVRGMFGAGSLTDLSSNVANVALWQFALATDHYRFVMYPDTVTVGSDDLATVGFEGFFDLHPDSFLSLSEASVPKSSFDLYNVEGTLGWKDGHILIEAAPNATGTPSITLRNQLLIGESVDFSSNDAIAGEPLIGNIGFGSNSYGRIAMPGGVWHSEIVVQVAP